MSDDPPSVRAALAVVAGSATAMALYAALRVVQASKGTEPNPAYVIWSEHAGYFWRACTAAYVGGMFALAVYVISKRTPIGTMITRALIVAIVAITLQGLLVP